MRKFMQTDYVGFIFYSFIYLVIYLSIYCTHLKFMFYVCVYLFIYYIYLSIILSKSNSICI